MENIISQWIFDYFAHYQSILSDRKQVLTLLFLIILFVAINLIANVFNKTRTYSSKNPPKMYSGEPNKQPNARKQLGVVLTVIQTIVNCVLVVLFIALVCLEINYAVIYSPQSIESSKNVITDNGDMYDLSNATVF